MWQHSLRTIAIHILSNISRSKGKLKEMKFGQLIKYNTRNVFVAISYTKYARETTPWPLFEKSKLSITLYQ